MKIGPSLCEKRFYLRKFMWKLFGEFFSTTGACEFKNPDVALYGTCFKIGKSSDCEFWIRDDTTISVLLCQFKYTVQEDGTAAIFLEGIGLGCIIYNGHYFGRRDVVRIRDGDEIDLGYTLYHKYTIVLKLPNVDVRDNRVVRSKVGQFDASSAEAWPGTFLLPSSSPRTIESLWAMPTVILPPAGNNVKIQKGINMSQLAPSCDMPSEFVMCIEEGKTSREARQFGTDVMSCSCIACSVERASIEDQINERDNCVTFDNFPYYLSQNTKGMLIESTFIHLKRKEFTNHTVELRTLSPRLLLSGPAGTEIYQELLAKALANHFGAKLLIFDISARCMGLFAKDTEFLKGDQRPKSKKPVDNWPSHMVSATKASFSIHQGTASNCQAMPKHKVLAAPYFSASAAASELNSFQRGNPVKYVRIPPGYKSSQVRIPPGYKSSQAPLWPSSWQLHRRPPAVPPSIHLIFQVLTRESKNGPMILFMKNIEKLIIDSLDMYGILKSELKNLAEGIVIICSHTQDGDDTMEMDNFGRLKQIYDPSMLLSDLFPNKVNVQIPQDEALFADWKQMLQRDVERPKVKENQQHIETVLSRNNLECDGFDTTYIKDQVLTDECAEKIVGWALSYHLMNEFDTPSRDGKLVISSESVHHALKKFIQLENESQSSKKSLKDVTLNCFEERLMANVILPSEIGIRFEDIGALEKVKDMLKEMVMLPLQRPELFCKGQLTKEKALAVSDGKPMPSLRGKADIRAIKWMTCGMLIISASSESPNISELLRWNELYGEGGLRPKLALDYFM